MKERYCNHARRPRAGPSASHPTKRRLEPHAPGPPRAGAATARVGPWRAAGAPDFVPVSKHTLVAMGRITRARLSKPTHIWRTRRSAEIPPKSSAHDQADITTRSGHPLRGNRSFLKPACACDRPRWGHGLRRSQKDTFLSVLARGASSCTPGGRTNRSPRTGGTAHALQDA